MSHTLVNGRHFLRCDDVGDVASGIDGLYADDTRRLSRWELAVDGHRPQPLAERATGHAELLLTQRVPHADGDVLVRRHLVLASDAFHERISFLHHGLDEIDLHVELRVASDGADLFTVKREEFTRVGGDAGTVGGIAARVGEGDGDGDGDASTRTTTVHLAPGVETHLDLHHGLGEAARDGGFDAALRATRDDLAAWRASMPQLSVDDPSIAATWQASLDDLAALRIPADPADGPGNLIAAGVPWFLTLFGRDAIITCLQTLVLGAHRARPTLRCLARLQATADEPDRDAEPGKILHELRSGAIAERGYDAYYGSIDSTPLFLMLLGEYHAWTADDELVRELWPSALAALTWLETRGDLDDDGFLEFARRSPHGLEVQSWKDSPDSQRHADGSIAQGPIAPIEAQAYAYAARVALARLARQVMGDDALAARLERDASRLRARFDAAFWSPTGYALALDGDKRPLAVPASNIGHLPWCGITGA
ncbi:MAG: hypothetical protein JWO69_1568, partial [Thermoleophilia bacterium]|nr:hypothetical protein [Thermoleophilia bacterium]